MNVKTLILLKAIKEVVVSSAAVITVILALLTVNDWKEETQFTHKRDVAHDTLESVYGLRNAMYDVRYMYSELLSLIDLNAERRLEILLPAILEVRSNALQAEVAFGSGATERLDRLLKMAKTVEYTFRIGKWADHEEANGYFKDQMKRSLGDVTLFFSDAEKDAITMEVEKLIDELEIELKQFFR